MKIGICDAKTEYVQMIKNILEGSRACLNLEINVFSPSELLNCLERKEIALDIVVLGIEFIEESFDGIYLGKILNRKLPDCQIIYVNDSQKDLPDVYETRHCYCIRAGDMEHMLPKAIEKAMEIIGDGKVENSLSIACNGHMIYILQDDIKYIEKVARTIKIHTEHAVYSCYMTLSNICRKIEGGGRKFLRCHGSFIVNFSHIKMIESDNIYMDDGVVIPIGRTFKARLKEIWGGK